MPFDLDVADADYRTELQSPPGTPQPHLDRLKRRPDELATERPNPASPQLLRMVGVDRARLGAFRAGEHR
jgi:hypothetical protein